MCTSACDSSYGADIRYLQGLTTISPDNGTLKKLRGKTNLKCINNFLASIATKIK